MVGDGADVLACDVRDQASVDSAVAEAISRLGGVDVDYHGAHIPPPDTRRYKGGWTST